LVLKYGPSEEHLSFYFSRGFKKHNNLQQGRGISMWWSQHTLTPQRHRYCVILQEWYLPSIMVTGSSILGRNIFGPNTVARFWTLILLMLE